MVRFKYLNKQPNVRGIAANATATGEIATVGTHYATYLRCLSAAGVPLTRAEIIAAIGDIIIRINGDQIVEASSTFLLDLQKYYGDAFTAGNVDGIIPLNWARRHFATDQERSVYALGMDGISSFTIDAKILSTLVLSSIEVLSLVTDEKRKLGQHVRIARFPQNFATTGVQEISSLPKEGVSVGYQALHIEKNTGTFDKVTCKVNNVPVIEDVDPNLNQVRLKETGRTPQAAYFHLDFATNNDLFSFLPMAGVQDFRQQITWKTAAPGNFNIYREAIFGLNVK